MMRLRGQLICMTEDEVLAVRQNLPDHIRLTRAEAGYLSFEVTPTDDPMVYEVMEAFRDRPSFDAHQARTRDSAWFAATRGILRDFRLEEVGD
ncbi:MAG: putative quinol monooxygenase [Cypionkella sp.]